ncbi:hypothetical protein TBK1r_22480 [Stieleria magnilauensis]|uniref:Uncharacterized protein n=1 Tax=Stieleria magnilauensis TaxID=2527963 RepID=A0ABX5XRP9_9BACT|nr:hypothetical protein TBK1r_22480 [Planctomycetes bacterium TBK1r]
MPPTKCKCQHPPAGLLARELPVRAEYWWVARNRQHAIGNIGMTAQWIAQLIDAATPRRSLHEDWATSTSGVSTVTVDISRWFCGIFMFVQKLEASRRDDEIGAPPRAAHPMRLGRTGVRQHDCVAGRDRCFESFRSCFTGTRALHTERGRCSARNRRSVSFCRERRSTGMWKSAPKRNRASRREGDETLRSVVFATNCGGGFGADSDRWSRHRTNRLR